MTCCVDLTVEQGQHTKFQNTKKDLSQILFFIRTIPDWNKLPSDVNLAPTSTAFKARLKKSDPCNPPPVARKHTKCSCHITFRFRCLRNHSRSLYIEIQPMLVQSPLPDNVACAQMIHIEAYTTPNPSHPGRELSVQDNTFKAESNKCNKYIYWLISMIIAIISF